MTTTPDPIEDLTEDGFCIRHRNTRDMNLEQYYDIYNRQCFGGNLPFTPILWAESITEKDGNRANAIYVSGDSKLKKRYIAIDERLCGMFPLDRLCLLHEMVHVRLGPDSNHGEDFICEFRRVLDANKWEVMGC